MAGALRRLRRPEPPHRPRGARRVSGFSVDKLVYTASQIADFFVHQPRETAALKIASHINAYWGPRMRQMIVDHLQRGGEGLKPATAEAVRRVKTARPETAEHALAAAGDPSVPHTTE